MRLSRILIAAALIGPPPAAAGAQPSITADAPSVRRVLADTALVHELPAQRRDDPLNVSLDVTRPERAAMSSALVQLSALLRNDLAVQRASGVALVFRNDLAVDTAGPGRRLTGVVSMRSWPFAVVGGRLGYSSAARVELNVNPDLCPAEERTYGVGFRRAPRFDGRFHGFPMLDSVVVITHRTAPPCLPVSRARVVTALRRNLDEILAQLPPGDEMHERAHALDALLAGMSPDERASDAYLSGHACDAVVCFGTPAEEGAQQLVVPNPDFYDRTRLATVQAVTISLGPLLAPSNPPNAFHAHFILEVLETLDWPALSALVR